MDFSDQSSQDEFTCINPILKDATSTQNRKDYPNTIAAACRFGISRRALCAVANALLSDMDILTPQNALDPSKVQRMFDKHAAERICENANEKQFTCVMFDGRIDSTLQFKVSPEGDLTLVAETMKEEHITIVEEPRGKYRENFLLKLVKQRIYPEIYMNSLLTAIHNYY